jgi:hypothetical protein
VGRVHDMAAQRPFPVRPRRIFERRELQNSLRWEQSEVIQAMVSVPALRSETDGPLYQARARCPALYQSPRTALQWGAMPRRVRGIARGWTRFPFPAPCLPPQSFRLNNWIDLLSRPPALFVAGVMERSMMGRTDRHHPFVARLRAHSAELGKTDMVCLARPSTTNETWLPGNNEIMSEPNIPAGCRRIPLPRGSRAPSTLKRSVRPPACPSGRTPEYKICYLSRRGSLRFLWDRCGGIGCV